MRTPDKTALQEVKEDRQGVIDFIVNSSNELYSYSVDPNLYNNLKRMSDEELALEYSWINHLLDS